MTVVYYVKVIHNETCVYTCVYRLSHHCHALYYIVLLCIIVCCHVFYVTVHFIVSLYDTLLYCVAPCITVYWRAAAIPGLKASKKAASLHWTFMQISCVVTAALCIFCYYVVVLLYACCLYGDELHTLPSMCLYLCLSL